MFKRRFKALTRELANIFSIILPFFFVTLGAMVGRGYQDSEYDGSSSIGLTFYCYYCLVAYCLLTTTFAFTHVAEKEHNVKYLLKVSGGRPHPYWIGTFLADGILGLIIWGLMMVIGLIFLKYSNEYMGPYIVIMLVFSLDIIAYSYLASFLFDSVSTLWMGLPFITLFGNLLPSFFLLIITAYMKASFLQVLIMIYSPFFNVLMCVIFYVYKEIQGYDLSGSHQMLLIQNWIGYLIAMILQIFVFFLLIVL